MRSRIGNADFGSGNVNFGSGIPNFASRLNAQPWGRAHKTKNMYEKNRHWLKQLCNGPFGSIDRKITVPEEARKCRAIPRAPCDACLVTDYVVRLWTPLSGYGLLSDFQFHCLVTDCNLVLDPTVWLRTPLSDSGARCLVSD